MAKALNVVGLMNVQYALKGHYLCLGSEPTRSRTVPFVAKTIGTPIAKIASRIMAGESLEDGAKAYGGIPSAKSLVILRQRSGLPILEIPRCGRFARAGNALNR